MHSGEEMIYYSVLIVDDHQEWCYLLKNCIDQYSRFDVAPPVFDGGSAIKYIEAHKPDVIILDLVMPVFDGLYVIEHIRSKMAGYKPFIYVLSAIGTEKTNRIMKNMDVDYYSIKPISPNVVAGNLQKLVADKDISSALLNYGSVHPAELEEGDGFPDLQSVSGLDTLIDDFLYELGAPVFRLSTISVHIALKLCLLDETNLQGVVALYKLVAEQFSPPVKHGSVERNIRSAVLKMQSSGSQYFAECFPYCKARLTNTEFLNGAVFILRRKIEDKLGSMAAIPTAK